MEVQHGVVKRGPGAVGSFSHLLSQLPLLEVNREIAHRCANLRVHLDKPDRKVRTRTLDLLIAATALEYDLMVVTSNVRDFEDVPGLKLYRPHEAG